MSDASIHLYSMAICPFVQRTRILLGYKGIAYEHTEMDPTSVKSAWFQQLNPVGKVPVIDHGGRILYESLVINEYLEEVYPERALLPPHPYQRALCRILIDSCLSFIKAQYALQLNQDRTQDQSLTEEALATYRAIDAFLMRHNPQGTWAFDSFGLADLTFAPFFQRTCVNRYYRWFEVPDVPQYQRVLRFRDACLSHPLVQATGMPEDHYIKLYYDHARGYRRGVIPPGVQSAYDMTVPLDVRPLPPRPARPSFMSHVEAGPRI